LAEATEEVAKDEGCQKVEEEDFTHEPKEYVRHLNLTVVALCLEVCDLGPDECNTIE